MRTKAKPASPKSGHTDKDLSGAGLRTFFQIAKAWNLKGSEQAVLLDASTSTLDNWKKDQGVTLRRDTLDRLSYILGIYKALQILLPEPRAADEWIKRPNDSPLFEGRPPLDRMLSGGMMDLHFVRQYLDAQRGGWS